MKLRLGQPVHATDGEFGEVGDIVIDPLERTVTHLVVEPHRQHHQARLVPISLVTVEGDVVHVALDRAHIRQLQGVAHDDYVRFGEKLEGGEDWDVGIEDVLALPYWDSELGFDLPMDADQIDVAYDRVPKGECEIRRRSIVTTDDGRTVGHVEGFVADDDHLVAVVVRAGRPGRRHNAVVPMSTVAVVRNDEIQLGIDRERFGRMPRADGLEGPLGESTVRSRRRRAAQVGKRFRQRTAKLVGDRFVRRLRRAE